MFLEIFNLISKKGGFEPLHWHKETQHYFVYKGKAIFQIGDQERFRNLKQNHKLSHAKIFEIYKT